MLSGGIERPLLTLVSENPIAEMVGSLSAHGNILTFAVGGSAFIYDLGSGHLIGFEGVGPDTTVPSVQDGGSDAHKELTTINATAVSSAFAAWTFGGGSASDTAPIYVYNLHTGSLERIDVTRSFGELYLGGKTVAWRSLIGQGTVIGTLG
jgi:hypothetical protein